MSEPMILQPEKTSLNQAGKKRLVVVVVYMMLTWVILFMAAGTWRWPGAWLFVGLQTAVFLTMGLWVARHNPGLINERGRKSDKTKGWDKVFALIYAPQLFLLPIVAGLDYRNGWTAVPLLWQIVGLIVLVPAMLLPYWAMYVNNFLVTTVRLQKERGQYVVTIGPYHYVRHPMYVGAILTMICTPLALGSWWALVPGGIGSLAMIVRTALEDNTLQNELPGYAAYAQQTPYRLLPGVW
jgi:protein-S-isoprenylcysteine O-methyltransferase Ste14